MLPRLTDDERASSGRGPYMSAAEAWDRMIDAAAWLLAAWDRPWLEPGTPFQHCRQHPSDRGLPIRCGCLMQIRCVEADPLRRMYAFGGDPQLGERAKESWTAQIEGDERIPISPDNLAAMDFAAFSDAWDHMCEVQHRIGLGLDIVAGAEVP